LQNFADRLISAIERRGSAACVNLDPVLEKLPAPIRGIAQANNSESAASAFLKYGRAIIDAVGPLVPVVKINSAYFEVYGAAGVAAYAELISHAHRTGLQVIGDVKRGDIGHTAEMYAQAHLGGSGDCVADAITINGYFGEDGIKPFVEAAANNGRGVFVLVRTSNPSAGAIQDMAVSDGRKVHELVAVQVSRWSSDSRLLGRHGYSSIGAVAGTRTHTDAATLRKLMPQCYLLVPGYGAQGGTADEFRPYFNRDGLGAIVAAGRSVIFAYERPEYQKIPWESAAERACKEFVEDLARIRSAI
jgi:orotidine-5'-phosphate decarboxylase